MTDWAKEIRNGCDQIAQHFKAHDFKALSEVYMENCIMMPPGQDVGEGRQACFDLFAAISGLGSDGLVITSHEIISSSNDMAVDRGRYVFSRSDGSVFEKGKSLMVWKRVGGQVKVYTDMWSPDPSKSE